MKVKFFSRRQNCSRELQDDINAWFAENTNIELVDIRFTAAPTTRVSTDSNLVVCIIYKGEANGV